VLSAFGMLAADVIKDYVKTVMLSGDTLYESLADLFLPIETQGHQEIAEDGIEEPAIWLEKSLDMRLRGQSYEINVPFTRDFLAEFHKLHHQNYGYSRPKSPVEIVSMRLRARGVIEPPKLPTMPAGGPDPTPALIGIRPVVFNQDSRPSHLEVPFYRGENLLSGNRIAGPCIIVRSDTTILLNPGDRGAIDEYGNLQLVIG
jgi:N-methylhydantoinase A